MSDCDDLLSPGRKSRQRAMRRVLVRIIGASTLRVTGIADHLDRSETDLRDKLYADGNLPLADLPRLVQLLPELLDELAAVCGKRVAPLEATAGASVERELVHVNREVAELGVDVYDAVADDFVDARECRTLQARIADAQLALRVLDATLSATGARQ